MSVATKRKGEKSIEGFDEGKLAELSEPIRVTVHKDQQGRPMPIILPTKPGEPGPGIGLSIEDVRQLNEFLPNDWSGGGRYTCKAIGDNGVEMIWQAYFPIAQYPERVPPTMRDAAGRQQELAGVAPAPVVPLPLVSSPPPGLPPMSVQPAWLAQAASMYPPLPQAGQQFPAYPSSAFAPSYGGFQGSFQAPTFNSPDAEIRKEREERLKMEARLERQQLENAYKEQLSGMQSELRRMQETVQSNSSRPAENEQVAALKAELERARQEREQDKLAAQMKEQAAQFQHQLLEMQRQNDQRLAEMQRQTELLVAKLSDRPAGPDPTIMLMIEMQKMQSQQQIEAMKSSADAQKEVARLQADAQKEAARNAIGPREMMEIVAKGNVGHEQMTNMMGRTWEIMTGAVEQMRQAMGGGEANPALEMIGQGLQGSLALAQRYIEMKGQGQTTQARAAVAIEQARANAVAQAHIAQQQQLAGGDQDEEEEDEETARERHEAEVLAAEQELFGPALESVQRMRLGVQSGVLPPDGAANALLQGIDQVIKMGVKVPVFDLWVKHEWSKLVDTLIPDAPTSFKEQMLQALHEQVEAAKQTQREQREN